MLTETLLKHDFDLHVSIPSNNLNPAITLRMNYILWIEDLMRHSKLEMNKVIGIDIGESMIVPLKHFCVEFVKTMNIRTLITQPWRKIFLSKMKNSI